MAFPLASLVDLECHPIDRPDSAAYRSLVARGQASLAESGFCALPGFIQPAALEEMAREASIAAVHGYRRDQFLAAYDPDVVAALPADHVASRTHPYRMRVIAQDRLPAAGAILSLYNEDALPNIIADLLGEPALYRCADALVSCTVTVLDPGDEHGWHFDSNDFVASLLLQAADEGGQFEFVPSLRSENDENYGAVERIYDGDRTTVRAPAIAAGTLMLFQGKYALHRVSPVQGRQSRLIALFSFDRRPDMVFPTETKIAAVGRAQ